MWTSSAAVFAEIDLEKGGTYALLVVLGGGAQWVLTFLFNRVDKRKLDAKEDEKTAIDRYRELYDQQQADKRECREEVDRLEERVGNLTDKVLSLTVSIVRAVEWIKYHETLMRNGGLKYEPFDPGPGPGPHPPPPEPEAKREQ